MQDYQNDNLFVTQELTPNKTIICFIWHYFIVIDFFLFYIIIHIAQMQYM